MYRYFCERRGVFQYNLHDFSTSIEAKSCPNNCTVVVSIFKNKFGRHNAPTFCNKSCEEETLEVQNYVFH